VSTDNKRFIDIFSIVIATLVAISMGLFILSRYLASGTQMVWTRQNPEGNEQLEARLAPVGTVALPGDEPPASPPSASVAVAAPAAAPLSGQQVYNVACFACHGPGIGGAPKTGDKAAWSARVAQGAATLRTHAIQGFQGAAGFMPPKGGRVDLSDAEIIGAVDYMVAQSQ
jgi:cytochrome c5